MKSKATCFLFLALVLGFGARCAVAQSLGDLARAQKEKQSKEEKKPAKVYTNEDLPASKSGSGSSSPAPSNSQIAGLTITAITKDGASVQLSPDEKTDLIFMATWCPHSKALKDMLNDSRMRPYWAGRKLVFLYSNDEWSRVKSELDDLVKRGKLEAGDKQAQLDRWKRDAGSPYVLEPAALGNLPGNYYFCSVPDEVTGFPEALSVQGYNDRYIWISQVLKVPNELSNKLSGQYEPAKDNTSH